MNVRCNPRAVGLPRRTLAGAVLMALLVAVALPALPVAADHCGGAISVGDIHGNTTPPDSWGCHVVEEAFNPDLVVAAPPPYEFQPPYTVNVVDSDGDGLSDDDELYVYGTDPYNPDTDYDGWGDSLELFGCIGDGIPGDPFNPSIRPPCIG
jgi:hypothetical protein